MKLIYCTIVYWHASQESEMNNEAKGYGNPPQGEIHTTGSYKCSSLTGSCLMSWTAPSSRWQSLTEKYDDIRPQVQKSVNTYSDAFLP